MEEEIKRIKEAKAYLLKWQDMPFSYLNEDVAKILNLNNDKPTHNFIMNLSRREIDVSAQMMVDARNL